MAPVNVLNRSLIRDAISEAQASAENRCRRHAAEFGRALLGNVSMCQCEWDRADSEQEQYVKRASDKMRLNGGISLSFHYLVVVVIRIMCALLARHDAIRSFFFITFL
jgi:hypothetical protein